MENKLENGIDAGTTSKPCGTCESCGRSRSRSLSEISLLSRDVSPNEASSRPNGSAGDCMNQSGAGGACQNKSVPSKVSHNTYTERDKTSKSRDLGKAQSLDCSCYSGHYYTHHLGQPTRGRHHRSSSDWSLCSSVSGPQPAIYPRENKASTYRKQLTRLRHENTSIDENQPMGYLTPVQKKEQTVRDLRRELQIANEKLRDKDEEILRIVSTQEFTAADVKRKEHTVRDLRRELQIANEKDDEIPNIVSTQDFPTTADVLIGKSEDIETLKKRLEEQQRENAHLKEQLDVSTKEGGSLKEVIDGYDVAQAEREERHREMYLMMYEKGKRSADFMRRDTLEELATNNPDSVPLPELMLKLTQTQVQLSELQSVERQRRYENAALLSPTTDSEVTLRCLRDALYHYLTMSDKETKKQHLTILLNLAAFSEDEKRKIDNSMSQSKPLQRRSSNAK